MAKRKRRANRDPMPRHVRPMLAMLVDAPFDRAGWLFEIKWDGYRAIAEIDGGAVSLYSRNQQPFTGAYPPIIDALRAIPHECVLDGEIVALKDGRADFHTLQQYKEIKAPLQYMVFDLLYLDGADLRTEPLVKRKALLRAIIPTTGVVAYSEHIENSGTKLFQMVKRKGIEGIIAKDGESRYEAGRRSGAWQKIKTGYEQEAVIVGFTRPRGSRKHLGALVLAANVAGRLRYIGHSGGGFSERELTELSKKLSKIATTKAPIPDSVPVNSPITWVQPKYVCEIKFTEWTPSGNMRHPIYVGMRPDKKPTDVVREGFPTREKHRVEKKTSTELKLSHLDKVFWPDEGYTKGDLIAYYERMSDTLLPYLKDRPQNLNRHPNGIAGKNFYQKNFTADVPDFVRTHEIWSESNNDYLRYLVCDNKETLLYLANLGCIELNPWNSRIGTIDKPDYMILDLDPHERTFEELIVVAQEVRSVLDLACEEHYIKTSGKSGLHICVPLGARYRYEDAKNFAHLIMQLVHARVPELTSLERMPKKRGGKIYLDYLQNRKAQTLACAYSVRPAPGASVSTPLEWHELKKGLHPSQFTIKTIWKRLEKKGDLWKGTRGRGVDLKDAIRCLQEHLHP